MTADATPAEVDAAVIAACVERLKFNDDPLFRKLVAIAQRVVKGPRQSIVVMATAADFYACGGRGYHLPDCPEIGALE